MVQWRDDGLNEVGFCGGDGEPASVLDVMLGSGKMTHFLGISNSLPTMYVRTLCLSHRDVVMVT